MYALKIEKLCEGIEEISNFRAETSINFINNNKIYDTFYLGFREFLDFDERDRILRRSENDSK